MLLLPLLHVLTEYIASSHGKGGVHIIWPIDLLEQPALEVTLTAMRIDTQLCYLKDSVLTRWCLTVLMPYRDEKRVE